MLLLLVCLAGSPQATSTLTGRVVADDTGLPVANVSIALVSGEDDDVVLSDRDGRFAIQRPPGKGELRVHKAGFEHLRLQPRDDGSSLEIRLHRAAVLSGRVIDPRGDPVVDAQVALENPSTTGESSKPVSTTQTDDLGEYRFSGFAPGTYLVSAMTVNGTATMRISGGDMSFSFTSTKTYHPGVAGANGAERVEIARAETVLGVDVMVPANQMGRRPGGLLGAVGHSRALRVPPAGAPAVIHGRIATPVGAAIPGAVVKLLPGDEPFPQATTTADDEGRFELVNVPPGRVRVAASKAGFSAADPIDLVSPSFPDMGSGRFLDLSPGETREGVEITLVRLGTIAGNVIDELGERVEGASVRALRVVYEAGRRWLVPASDDECKSDDRGRFRFHTLTPGQYVLSATANLPGYARSYFPATTDAEQAQLIDIGSDGIAPDIDLSLTRAPTARLRGTILNAKGEPTTGGKVTLRSSARSSAAVDVPAGARIHDDGTFEFSNVTDGQYVIRADRGRLNSATEGEFGTLAVTVAGKDVNGLVVAMSAGSSISGHIRFDSSATGTPSNVEMELSPVPIDGETAPDSIATSSVDADWSFHLDGIGGRRRLRMLHGPEGWAVKAVMLEGVDITDQVLAFGRANQSLANVDIVLTDRISRLNGSVANRRGAVAPGAHVIVASTDRDRWYTGSRFLSHFVARPDGSFSIAGLPPDTYLIFAVARIPEHGDDAWQDPDFLDTLRSQASTVTLGAGETHSVQLRLLPR